MFGLDFTDVFFLILLQQVRKPPLLVFRFQKGSLGFLLHTPVPRCSVRTLVVLGYCISAGSVN